MRILITGATGFIGQQLVKALAIGGHDLVLTTRRASAPSKIDGQEWRTIDYAAALSTKDWRDIVRDIDMVINAVGIFTQTSEQSFAVIHDKAPRALFEACRLAGVQKIIQISALGTDEKATSAYHLSKKQAEEALWRQELDWVVLRPSLIIGGEGESWHFFKALAILPIAPVIGDGRQPLQPVTIEDVVKAVLLAVEKPEISRCTIDLVGEEQLNLQTYMQSLAKWMGRERFWALHIPYGLAGILAMGAPLFDNIPLNREAVTMLKEARVHDGGECRKKLGFMPTGVSTFLSQNPASQEDRIHARQYFLRPLLRYGLALMWIWAGVVSLFFYPHEDSLALLAGLGLHGQIGEISLYGAALVDILLGLALIANYRLRSMLLIQIGLIVSYTLALSWAAPHLWSDPFGALVKNIPIIIATLFVLSWTKE